MLRLRLGHRGADNVPIVGVDTVQEARSGIPPRDLLRQAQDFTGIGGTDHHVRDRIERDGIDPSRLKGTP